MPYSGLRIPNWDNTLHSTLTPAARSFLATAFAFLATACTTLFLRCFVGPLTPEFLAILVNIPLHTAHHHQWVAPTDPIQYFPLHIEFG